MTAALAYDLDELQTMSVEEYLEFEKHSEVKHEYHAGHVVECAGASDPYELVALNAASALNIHLKGKGCRAYKSDMKLRLMLRGKTIFYYPDVMVVCDPADNNPIHKQSPRLLIEVCSSDWKKDFVEKFAAYTSIASLEEYAIIWHDPAKPEVTIFRREDGWEPGVRHVSGAFTLRSVGLTLAVEDLYAA